MIKKTYFIQGMHCSACEVFIARSIRNLKGIKSVDISLAKEKIVIEAQTHQAMPSLYKLNQMFNKDGYSFFEKNQKETQTLTTKNILTAIVLFILIIFIFFSFNGSKFLSNLYVNSNSNLPAFFFFGIAAGISSCAALVGGLLLSVQEGWVDIKDTDNNRSFLPFLLFNASRIITFAVLGGLLGALGGFIKLSVKASSILAILISLLMFIIGMQMLGVKFFQKISLNFSGQMVNSITTGKNIQKRLMPIVFGAITFFIPCGFTLIAQSRALESGSFFRGFSILTAFALGTLPILLLISYSSVKFYKDPKFSNTFRLLSGLLIIFFAVFTINSQFGILQLPNLSNIKAPSAEVPLTAPEISMPVVVPASQVMQMEVKGFEYFPKTITIKAGIPTKFEITDNGSIGCARAVFARGLYPDVILLEPGLNSVEFIAPAAGTYQISCTMWMVEPITVIVE
jgi:sulfite exporter TauE/SafE/copper chaperone CopZ